MDDKVFTRTTEFKFMDATIRIIGLEDFIAMKIFAGSPKDMEDAKAALEISSADVDMPLLKKLTLQYGKNELQKLESLVNLG